MSSSFQALQGDKALESDQQAGVPRAICVLELIYEYDYDQRLRGFQVINCKHHRESVDKMLAEKAVCS